MPQLILASASPRRQALLDQIGIRYTVHPADLDESVLANESPHDYVARLAAAKSTWVQNNNPLSLPVLAADTAVVCAGNILGKPLNQSHATEMLLQLSGKTHQVYTAVSLRRITTTATENTAKAAEIDNCLSAISITDVTFRQLSFAEIVAYWQTGEPLDKAGAYAIQGLGSVFVAAISGSFSGVVGLPLFETAALLAQVGISIPHD